MTHAIEQITTAIASMLDGATQWKAVYESRIPPARMVWPFVQVYAEQDATDIQTIHPGALLDRSVTVTVRGVVRVADTQTVEKSMMTIAEEIEKRIIDSAFSISIKGITLAATQFDVELNTDERPAYGVMQQSWIVNYMTVSGAPQTLI